MTAMRIQDRRSIGVRSEVARAVEPIGLETIGPAPRFGRRCPDCGGPLAFGEGCSLCPICGHSACA